MEWDIAVNGFNGLCWVDEKVHELDNGDGCIICELIKTTQLCD